MRIPRADGETASPLVIRGGTLVDGTGRAPLSDSVIVIQGGQIVTVATVAAGSIPVDGRRLETHGKWVIPGLIDMQVHYDDFNPTGPRSAA